MLADYFKTFLETTLLQQYSILTSLYWGQNNFRLLELLTVWIFGVSKAFEVFIGVGTKL